MPGAHGSQVALDFAGKAMIALDDQRRALWSTPMGEAMPAASFPEFAHDRTLPGHVIRALLGCRIVRPSARATARIDFGDRRIELTHISHYTSGEWLFLISEASAGEEQQILAVRYALTPREAELLLWISRGQPNRQISSTLGIRPKTVNRHLEQNFKKLGVRNRASAAATAAETLLRWLISSEKPLKW